MKPWYEELRDWEGTAEELVETVSGLVGEDIPAEDFAPNVRLLRHYQSIGAVSRPQRRGKEAIYGFRQLQEVMVVRTLVLDGWPLAKIAEITSTASDQELIEMIPEPGRHRPSPNAAQELVARYSLREGSNRASRRSQAAGAPGDLASMGLDLDEYAMEPVFPELLELIELEPMPGIRVSVDRNRLQRLDASDIRGLGRAVEQALIDARRRVRGVKDDE